jgi:septal ring factor EnvC (AmiA/AmiB activator)
MGPTQPINVTEDALTKHRLEQLEEFATGWHAAERRVDTLALSLASVEKSVATIAESLEKNAAGMTRLHERLDTALTAQAKSEAREQGRAEVRAEMEAAAIEVGRQRGLAEASQNKWRVIAVAVPATVASCGVIVALLALLLN